MFSTNLHHFLPENILIFVYGSWRCRKRVTDLSLWFKQLSPPPPDEGGVYEPYINNVHEQWGNYVLISHWFFYNLTDIVMALSSPASCCQSSTSSRTPCSSYRVAWKRPDRWCVTFWWRPWMLSFTSSEGSLPSVWWKMSMGCGKISSWWWPLLLFVWEVTC